MAAEEDNDSAALPVETSADEQVSRLAVARYLMALELLVTLKNDSAERMALVARVSVPMRD